MAREIERKFLVTGDAWRDAAEKHVIRQGYLGDDATASVRVRVKDDAAFLTIKGRKPGITRAEFEYPIPRADADALLDTLCRRPLIEKTRYTVEYASHIWDIDVFEGDNAGLILAEVELEAETDAVSLPDWAGEEVTDDPRYFNANLIDNPYRRWAAAGYRRIRPNP